MSERRLRTFSRRDALLLGASSLFLGLVPSDRKQEPPSDQERFYRLFDGQISQYTNAGQQLFDVRVADTPTRFAWRTDPFSKPEERDYSLTLTLPNPDQENEFEGMLPVLAVTQKVFPLSSSYQYERVQSITGYIDPRGSLLPRLASDPTLEVAVNQSKPEPDDETTFPMSQFTMARSGNIFFDPILAIKRELWFPADRRADGTPYTIVQSIDLSDKQTVGLLVAETGLVHADIYTRRAS